MSNLTWTTGKARLSDLEEYERNPVELTERDARELAKSIKKYPQVLPYIAAAPKNGSKIPLLDGHQRKKVSLELLGMSPSTVVDVRFPSRKLTDKERQELIIRLRKNTGRFDDDGLLNWFDSSDLLDWGFEQKELEVIGFEFEDTSKDADEITSDRFEEVAKKWETKEGQLWSVGNHYLYCGDSLNSKSIEIVLQGQEPSLINADPPYGVSIVAANGYVGGGESEKGIIPFGGKKRGNVGGTAAHIAKTGMTYMESNKKNRRGTVGASKPFGSKAERGSDGAAHIVEVGKYPVIIGDENTDTAKKAVTLYLERFDNAFHVWWGANYYSEVLKPSPCWLVWNKETTGNFADCELAWSSAEMSAKLFTHRWNGMLRDSERERRWHPTQKPAALAEWICGLFTEEGDVILDPFGGAGWSVIGAENCNRKACVIEKSHEYLAVQLERMSTAFPHLKIEKVKNGSKTAR